MSRFRIINSSNSLLVQTRRRISSYQRGFVITPGIVPYSSLSSSFSAHLSFPQGATMIGRFIRKISSVAVPYSHSHVTEEVVEDKESYENAIKTLNTLQSNAATLAKIRENRDHRRSTSIPNTIAGILESGLTLDDIDNLDVVHVAGTKGKGMTCAFTESILRQAGLKTGFFSSPHLTAVRERIRINGRPLSEEQFARTFFTVYEKLKHLQEEGHACEMPHYFRFLMIMAFHVFIEEKVDAVILEVGIGGKFDTTNFIRKPIVVGISSLGLEHQQVLGSTLEEIASQKAGIMKIGVPTFTTCSHPPHIETLLREHAKQVDSPLTFVKPMNMSAVPLGVDDGDGGVAGLNAALAINLANEVLIRKHSHIFPRISGDVASAVDLPYSSDPQTFLPFQLRGLQYTKWDGRFHRVDDRKQRRITYFLDGAHTKDSLEVTLQWFNRMSSSQRSVRLLVFNLTGERDPTKLMEPLVAKEIFDLAVFCPFVASSTGTSTSPDTWSALSNDQDPMEGCRNLTKIWEEIQDQSKGVVLGSAEETLEYIRELAEGEKCRIRVLITGSLHLVGTFLSVLDPHRND